MGKRRFTQVATSDDEDDAPPSNTKEEQQNRKKRKKLKLSDVEEEEEQEQERGRKKRAREEEKPAASGEDDDEAVAEDAKSIGDVVRVSGKGRGRRRHYESFEYDGNRYDLEDSVLLVPEESNQKPYVAIIKDITQGTDGSMMVTGQWFYRPEEAEKKGGGNWQSHDTRELFYSFHRDEVPAESVMHKCVVHFIPRNKQIPNRKQHPGFIVKKVYDTEQRRLFKLTDKDYEDNKQHEIDVLVLKTLSRVGDLPDIETEDALPDQEDPLKNKRILRRKNMSPLDVSRDDEATTKSGQPLKAETPGSVTSTASEYYNILSNFKALTGETQRDKWLDKLLQGIQFICSPMDSGQSDDKENAEELASKEPEKSEHMQMTDARCKRCTEKKVGVIDIIQSGLRARYQLECIACGNNWYASRDEALTLTIDGPSSAKTVGTAPLATAKFEDVEKKLLSPRESEKSVNDVFKKTTEAYMPVLDTQKSFNKSRTENTTTAIKAAD
ncbi:Chromatin remodeling protein like [Actinidia chinensis var. chinensis]|uniref:Chromatin remodeling protein like n=1 Tax=Actinidia chinensis var. chinensis TaxID=1590841 RepID=A0A2R6PHZ7_ACTCC|nr:Chromatin remodeling protein like [Actinidia chinensis var. chinensis]